MCGIFAVFGYTKASSGHEFREFVKTRSSLLTHRGPDWSGVLTFDGKENALAHERLSIVGTSSGSQPLTSTHGKCCLTVNGEIYNHLELQDKLEKRHEFQTQSDCEVILHLWEDAIQQQGPESFVKVCQQLDGIFAFVIFDGKDWYAASDILSSKHCSVW